MMKLFKLLCVSVLLMCMAGTLYGGATYQLGPDAVADNPATPYIFTNSADGYGYQLEITPHSNPGWEYHVPIFTLTNTSTNGGKILSFVFTIGDTAFNFDHLGTPTVTPVPHFATDLNNDGSYGYSLPDDADDGIRSDYVEFSQFAGFDPQDVFVFLSDVDKDSGLAGNNNTIEDFRNIFWNNGQLDNSTITVVFDAVHTPAPGAMLLGSMGVAFVGWLRRRKML